MIEQVTIEGIVESVIFHNKDNGFTVFSVNLDDAVTEELVCVGNLPRLSVGEHVRVFGAYTNHPTYGKQLAVQHCEKNIPETEAGIERYLASGAVKGVRKGLAKRIVSKFGKNTLTVIEQYPERLAQIKGITLERAMAISALFHEQAELRRIIMYLQQLGISYTYAMKMYKKYSLNTIDVLQANPYALADEIIGIGFKIADEIAFKMGITSNSPYRIKCAIKYILNNASNNGHVYLPKEKLTDMAAEMLELSKSTIENVFIQMQIEKTIMQDNINGEKAVYLKYYYNAENYVARKIFELSKNVQDKKLNVSGKIEFIQEKNGMLLAENQKRAVMEVMTNGMLVITGGPGTGKTTTIKTIISILEQERYKIELAAPTGRAAKRMSEATGREAKTIHRLLEISFGEESGRNYSYGKNEDTPLEADAIIIDESSMVDILLMSALLKAIPVGAKLILVGDVDQLPSVGPGNVLKDIISSGHISVVRLNEVFRQAQESAIVMNAHRINRGEAPILNEKNKDFFFVKRAEPQSTIDAILGLILERLPKYAKCNRISDIQVLTPMRKSLVGLINLNNALQRAINPPAANKKEKEVRNIVFREGDKVMQIKNNYNVSWRLIEGGRQTGEGMGIFNGDMGIIHSIDEYEEEIAVMFDDNKLVIYDFSRLEELELAYAITIHKSQGSEYKVVIMPIYNGPPMLMTRNLLYTGITRAKELAVIVGLPEAMFNMVKNNKEVNRYTSLKSRIQQMHEMLGDFN